MHFENSLLFAAELFRNNVVFRQHSYPDVIILCNVKVVPSSANPKYLYRTRVRSLGMLVSDSLTDSLTHSRLVNLIDVSLACADGNSKLVEVVDDNSVTFSLQFYCTGTMDRK